jgi:hypothetical protein
MTSETAQSFLKSHGMLLACGHDLGYEPMVIR